MIIQICTKCEQPKSLDNYYKTNQNKSGYRSWCKPCHYNGSNSSPNRKNTSDTYYKKRKVSNPALFMWKEAKRRAKFDYNDMDFSITVDDIVITEKCPYFNVPFVPLDAQWAHSLDRIDSSKGYVPGNVQVISRKANRMKNDATKQELIAFAKGVLVMHSKEVGADDYSM